MTKLVSLLGRKPVPAAERPAAPAPRTMEQPKAEIELDNELFLPIATQLGQENEAVRNLLIDAEHKLGELETIKASIGRLVDPVSKTLNAYEQTKSEKLSLQGVLNSTRIAHDKLRGEHDAALKKAASFQAEATRLREIVDVAQQSVTALEKTKAEQIAELAARRNQIVDLQRHVQQQGLDLQQTRAENHRIGERVAFAEKRAILLEGEAQAAQQKAMQSAQERTALQAALDNAHAELAQTARKLTETDRTLIQTQSRLKTVETGLAEAQAERLRLSAALDEANHKYRDDITKQNARFEALQARSTMTEKLLEEARATLIARADEIRAFEHRVIDTSSAHDNTGERLADVTASLAEREAQIKNLEQAHAAVSQHNQVLASHVTAHEAANESAQLKLREQADLVQLLEAQLKSARATSDLQIEQLNAQLQRERLERTMAEGALEAGRQDIARLLREISATQPLPGPVAGAGMTEMTEHLRSAA
jgi:chromosome segregation ATPase